MIGAPLCHFPRSNTFLWRGVPIMSVSIGTIPDMSCALQVSITLLNCGVIDGLPDLESLGFEMDRIWCLFPIMPRFWSVPPKLGHTCQE